MNIHDRAPGRGAWWGLRIAGLAIAGVIGAGLFALAFGWLVMLLWNWLMPSVFGLGTLGYWQAFGIVILAKLIFGGIGGHGGPRHRGRPWRAGKHGWDEDWGPDKWRHWRDYWREEGREAFERYAERRKAEPAPGETPPPPPRPGDRGGG